MMASINTDCENIRIEIKNNVLEEMEIDPDDNLSDGEIEDLNLNLVEDKECNSNETQKNSIWYSKNNKGSAGFTTGINIFSKVEQKKLEQRAHRFGLELSDCKSMTDLQLQELHDSLGIIDFNESQTRFNTLHMYGTQEMSTEDVFEYFGKYSPSSIEWINDESCNVVWLDNISAARALHGLSRNVKGMPVTGKCDPFQVETKEEKSEGRSVLLKKDLDELYEKEIIHVSDLNIPIPPGYWRLGESYPKAKYILLRFAKTTDKKPFKAERFSEYYKKYGNPNYGGLKGIISGSKKKRMRGIPLIKSKKDEIVKGNPWGSLAESWNNSEPVNSRAILIKHCTSIQNRLGNNKRIHSVSDDDQDMQKSKVPRMRMYADEEEARIKRLKELKTLQNVKSTMNDTSDLRNRIRRTKYVDRNQSKSPIRPITRYRSTSEEDEPIKVSQKSKINVIIKRPASISKPKVASAIVSQSSNRQKSLQSPLKSKFERNQSESDSESESSSSISTSDSDSDSSGVKNKLSNRFSKSQDIKLRLRINNEQISPLKIEINNEHYKT